MCVSPGQPAPVASSSALIYLCVGLSSRGSILTSKIDGPQRLELFDRGRRQEVREPVRHVGPRRVGRRLEEGGTEQEQSARGRQADTAEEREGRTTSPVPMMWTLRSGKRQLKDETSVGMKGCCDLLQGEDQR